MYSKYVHVTTDELPVWLLWQFTEVAVYFKTKCSLKSFLLGVCAWVPWEISTISCHVIMLLTLLHRMKYYTD